MRVVCACPSRMLWGRLTHKFETHNAHTPRREGGAARRARRTGGEGLPVFGVGGWGEMEQENIHLCGVWNGGRVCTTSGHCPPLPAAACRAVCTPAAPAAARGRGEGEGTALGPQLQCRPHHADHALMHQTSGPPAHPSPTPRCLFTLHAPNPPTHPTPPHAGRGHGSRDHGRRRGGGGGDTATAAARKGTCPAFPPLGPRPPLLGKQQSTPPTHPPTHTASHPPTYLPTQGIHPCLRLPPRSSSPGVHRGV